MGTTKIDLEDWRCRHCHSLLARVDRSALKPDRVAVEIRCRRCNLINYLTVDGDDLLTAA